MNDQKEKLFPVWCAWCLKKNMFTTCEFSTVYGSHGICPACMAKQLGWRWRAKKFLRAVWEVVFPWEIKRK